MDNVAVAELLTAAAEALLDAASLLDSNILSRGGEAIEPADTIVVKKMPSGFAICKETQNGLQPLEVLDVID